MLKIIAQATQRCQECDEPLPDFARKLFLQQDGLCPRCHQLLVQWGIDLDKVEYRDMSIKKQSMIVVPRVEFHTKAPKNSIPL